MPVKRVPTLGWTRRSAAISVLLAMEAQQLEVAERVSELQRAKGWTNEKLAYESGLSVKTISRVLNAKHEARGDTIRALAEALEVSEAEIRGATDPSLVNGDGGMTLVEISDLLTQLAARQDAVEAALAVLVEVVGELRRDIPRRRRVA